MLPIGRFLQGWRQIGAHDTDPDHGRVCGGTGDITSESDLVVAARQLEAARAREQAERAAQVQDPADADTAEVTRVV